MSRKIYVPTFIAFAATFIPVVLYFGIIVWDVPAAWIAIFVGNALLRAKFAQALMSFGHLAVYLLVFYAAARVTLWLSTRPDSQTVRSTIQVIVLLALFSCSFLRAITYQSLAGRGGTYTFWGAASRYFEHYYSR
jgi:hypothetical protein